MLIYLDLCCFNRPFDNQEYPRVQLETEAKLLIQQKIRKNDISLIWSFMLEYENSANPDTDVSYTIAAWEQRARVTVEPNQDIVTRAKEFQILGFDPKDSLHLSCAIEARADCFLTVDKGILKHRHKMTDLDIKNPLEFFGQED